jgi:hypothetical protein
VSDGLPVGVRTAFRVLSGPVRRPVTGGYSKAVCRIADRAGADPVFVRVALLRSHTKGRTPPVTPR